MLKSSILLKWMLFYSSPSMDKESRKRIHQVVKRFPNLDSNTVDAEDRKTIVARQKVVKKGGGRKDWPRDRPRFLHFSLFKATNSHIHGQK